MDVVFDWRGAFVDPELDRLHAEAFDHPVFDEPWRERLERHSLGWVTARDGDRLVGFVNLVWDGGVHVFVIDTMVASSHRHRGIGTELLAVAEREARAAGCEWLHADYDDDLVPFYEGTCGLVRTAAGLAEL